MLPQGYTFAWSGLAFEEKKSGGTSMLAFVFGLIIVFLVLAAQYESWTLPGAVMTAVPFGILGALTAIWLRGLDNDVYFQIGLLVLIGLGAKNAVLRVSAAVELRKQGKSIMEATILAGEQRLRPIIMTSLAFAFGVLPLAIAVGAGANARHSIGTGIIGGMLGETTLAMLYVPLFFYLFDRLNERGGEEGEGARAQPPAARRPTRRTRRGRATDARGTLPLAPSGRAGMRSALALAIALARALGRLHGRPRLHAPGGRRAGGVPLRAEGASRETANTEWWKQFGDPVLDGLIAEALAHNMNVKVAVANVEQAAGVLTQTRSPLFPQVSYQARGTRQRFSEAGSGARLAGAQRESADHLPGAAGASWEIDLWGRIRRLTEAARANLLATDEARRGVMLSLVASVAVNLPAAARPRRAARDREAHARRVRRVGASCSSCSSSTARSRR